MPKKDLELEIRRGSQRQDVIDAYADPSDSGAMRDYLTGWLSANKWGRGLWSEFELVAREPRGWKKLAKVRV
jgi:hypothetical protein